MKENSGLQCLVCLSKTVPIESIVIIKDIPDARGDKKKLHSIFQVKQEWINICFFIILKKKNNFIPNAVQVIRSIQRPRVMHSS